MMKFSEHMTE